MNSLIYLKRKRCFQITEKDHYHFHLCHPLKSFKENVPNFADFDLRRLKSFNYCWSLFLATSNRDPSFLVILSTLITDCCEMFDPDC
jgi:hypothetical protein